jgi:hypothetical protein
MILLKKLLILLEVKCIFNLLILVIYRLIDYETIYNFYILNFFITWLLLGLFLNFSFL